MFSAVAYLEGRWLTQFNVAEGSGIQSEEMYSTPSLVAHSFKFTIWTFIVCLWPIQHATGLNCSHIYHLLFAFFHSLPQLPDCTTDVSSLPSFCSSLLLFPTISRWCPVSTHPDDTEHILHVHHRSLLVGRVVACSRILWGTRYHILSSLSGLKKCVQPRLNYFQNWSMGNSVFSSVRMEN